MIELNYKVFGEGEPVVILHGLFGMLDNWQTFAKALATDYMVYVVDQRDHGRSPHSDEFNYHLLAEDLRYFCEQHWLFEARFIGHSMGGKTLLEFARDHEDMIEQMVVVDMGIKAYKGGHQDIINALNSLPIDQVSSRGEAATHLSKTIDARGVRQFLLKNLTRRKNGGYQWKMNLPLLTKAYPHILEAITYAHPVDVNCLFVRGSESSYIVGEDVPDIRATFPNAQVETVQGAGHWVHAEQPQQLLALVKDFFGQ